MTDNLGMEAMTTIADALADFAQEYPHVFFAFNLTTPDKVLLTPGHPFTSS